VELVHSGERCGKVRGETKNARMLYYLAIFDTQMIFSWCFINWPLR
jgi:hypothetical protein